MAHPSTERFADYWRGLAPAGSMPYRSSLNPNSFPDLLPQVFILGRRARGVFPFRLVGGLLADLHGRDLRGENFVGLWRPEDQLGLQASMELSRQGLGPVVARGLALSDQLDLTMPVEVLLAPLMGADGEADRFVGLYQPLARTACLMGRTIRVWSSSSWRPATPRWCPSACALRPRTVAASAEVRPPPWRRPWP